MVYTGYAVAALAYELFWRQGLGPPWRGGALIALYVFLCGLASYRRAAGAYSASDPPHPHLPRPPLEGWPGRAWWTRAWKRWTSSAHSPRLKGNRRMLAACSRHVCGADGPVCHSFFYRGLRQGLLLGAGAGPVPGALPHHAPRQRRRRGGALPFMGPCSAGIMVGWCCGALPLLEVLLGGPGRCSACAALAADTHRRRTS